MTRKQQTTVRRLGPGDEEVVRRLAERTPQTALLADERTILLAAFVGSEPVGFVLGYELPRRHGKPSTLFVYELAVDAAHRRRGIATQLMSELRDVGRARGVEESFVLTDPENSAANELYASLGGVRQESVMWEF